LFLNKYERLNRDQITQSSTIEFEIEIIYFVDAPIHPPPNFIFFINKVEDKLFLYYLCAQIKLSLSDIMQKNLVIVESPAKAKTIEKFLGKDYKVMSSYGHIRDLKKKEFSINTDTFQPIYEIPADKKELVKSLKENAQQAETVWLASDEDREGEAISWHLYDTLGLKENDYKRIVFNEITKDVILNSFEHARNIDDNLSNKVGRVVLIIVIVVIVLTVFFFVFIYVRKLNIKKKEMNYQAAINSENELLAKGIYNTLF
jgi:hypothetical protein